MAAEDEIRVKDVTPTIDAFRTGDKMLIDGPLGTANMSKDTLLQITAQNASDEIPYVVPRSYSLAGKGGSLFASKTIDVASLSQYDIVIDFNNWSYTSVSSGASKFYAIAENAGGTQATLYELKKEDSVPDAINVSIPFGYTKLIVMFRADTSTNVDFVLGENLSRKFEKLASDVDLVSVGGVGRNNISIKIDLFAKAGKTYSLIPKQTTWAKDLITLTGDWIDFSVKVYDASGTALETIVEHRKSGSALNERYTFAAPADSAYVEILFRANQGTQLSFDYGYDVVSVINSLDSKIDDTDNDLEALSDSVPSTAQDSVMSVNPFTMDGIGGLTFVNKWFKCVPNTTYYLYVAQFTPSASLSTGADLVVQIVDADESDVGSVVYQHRVIDDPIVSPISFKTTSSYQYVRVGIRAATGEEVSMKFGLDLENRIDNVSSGLDESRILPHTMYNVVNASNGGANFTALVIGDPHNQIPFEVSAGKAFKKFPSDCAICVGDITQSHFNFNSTEIEDFYSNLNVAGKPIYSVAGNHDAGQTYYPGFASTHEQLYTKIVKPMVDAGWLSNGEYQVGKPYWAHDIATKKIRLIGLYEFDEPLDCVTDGAFEPITYDASYPQIATSTSYSSGDCVNAGTFDKYSFRATGSVTTPSDFANATSANAPYFKIGRYNRVIGQTQAQWFVDTLLTTPQDYSVIVVMHSDFSTTALNQRDLKFANSDVVRGDCLGNHTMTSSPLIADAIQAFINGTSFSMNVVFSEEAAYLNTAGGGTYAYNVSADFSNKHSGVKFNCIVSGHNHTDLILKDSSHTGILGISVIGFLRSSVPEKNDLLVDAAKGYYDRITQMSVVDSSDIKVNLVKIGANVTTKMTARDYEQVTLT